MRTNSHLSSLLSSAQESDKMSKRQAVLITDIATAKQRLVRDLCAYDPHLVSSSSSSINPREVEPGELLSKIRKDQRSMCRKRNSPEKTHLRCEAPRNRGALKHEESEGPTLMHEPHDRSEQSVENKTCPSISHGSSQPSSLDEIHAFVHVGNSELQQRRRRLQMHHPKYGRSREIFDFTRKPMKFVWKIHVGKRQSESSNALRKCCKTEEGTQPSQFQDRIIFMSMYNDIFWEPDKRVCMLWQCNVCRPVRRKLQTRTWGHFLVQEMKKMVRKHVRWCRNSLRAWKLVFGGSSPFSRGVLKRKGKIFNWLQFRTKLCGDVDGPIFREQFWHGIFNDVVKEIMLLQTTQPQHFTGNCGKTDQTRNSDLFDMASRNRPVFQTQKTVQSNSRAGEKFFAQQDFRSYFCDPTSEFTGKTRNSDDVSWIFCHSRSKDASMGPSTMQRLHCGRHGIVVRGRFFYVMMIRSHGWPISRGRVHVRFGNFFHTLTCCTHIFLVYTHCAYTSHTRMRVTHMHGSRVCAVRMSSSLFHLAFYLLMFRPSWLLLFLDDHFEDHSRLRPRGPRTPSCRTFPTWKRWSSAFRPRSSCLATWPSSFLS